MRGMLNKALRNAQHSERFATQLQHRSLRRGTVIAMATNASITDKQVVVVGANRGIGYEVTTEPGTGPSKHDHVLGVTVRKWTCDC